MRKENLIHQNKEVPCVFDQIENYLLSLPKPNFHSQEEDEALSLRVSHGDSEAKVELFNSVSRMVVREAVKRGRGNEDLTMELIGVGNFAIWTSGIDTYEPSKAKFITYATKITIWAQNRSLKDAKQAFSISREIEDDIKKITDESDKFMAVYHRKPTFQELEKITNLKRRHIILAQSLIEAKITPLSELTVRDDDEEFEYEDNVQNSQNVLVDKDADEEASIDSDIVDDMTQKINQTITEIGNDSPRFACALALRIGLSAKGNWGDPMTLEEVAGKLGVTKERIRQMQLEILSRVEDKEVREVLRKLIYSKKEGV